MLKDTRLNEMYEKGEYVPLEKRQYIDLLMLALRSLRPGTVVHRMTGDPPKRLLVAPLWPADKKRVLNDITKAIVDEFGME